jgi:two-component sensor histidine kinase/ActR/RegA family two-component response regulator
LNAELEQRVEERTAELTAALDRQAILAREVDHRAKNALAVVQSIVRLTRADDVPGYIKAVEGRMHALSRAHDLLSQSRWEGASLARLIDEELEPYRMRGTGQIAATGPAVMLQPSVAQTLGLAIHELATNAAKYGALSTPDGKLRISWDLQPDSLSIRWDESGGPRVAPPTARGFGTKLIHASIEGQLNGHVSYGWEHSGLHCELQVPNQGQIRPSNAKPAPQPPESKGRQPSVLIVEDEALVAMMMADIVEELGFSVLGPCSDLSAALRAANTNDLAAAVLDINLGGELVYPAAQVLSERRVPFVFVTGYNSDNIDDRFREVTVLQKPVQIADLKTAFQSQGILERARTARRA